MTDVDVKHDDGWAQLEETQAALKLAAARIVELEEENGQLKEEMGVRQARIWAIQTALQTQQAKSDTAKFGFAVDLEAYLLGSHARLVANKLPPEKDAPETGERLVPETSVQL